MIVSEMFPSIQGTGHLLGTPQYFVRLHGCAVVRCPIRQWCDEPDSLDLAISGKSYNIPPKDIVEEAIAAVGANGWLHITGGEPADQASGVGELIKLAQRAGMKCHLQTSGVFNWEVRFDWITVSPKVKANRLQQRYGNEMVIVYVGQPDEQLKRYFNKTSFWHYYLVPLWKDGEASNTDEAKDAVMRLNKHKGIRHFSAQEWNLTIQAHKHWGLQ